MIKSKIMRERYYEESARVKSLLDDGFIRLSRHVFMKYADETHTKTCFVAVSFVHEADKDLESSIDYWKQAATELFILKEGR